MLLHLASNSGVPYPSHALYYLIFRQTVILFVPSSFFFVSGSSILFSLLCSMASLWFGASDTDCIYLLRRTAVKPL